MQGTDLIQYNRIVDDAWLVYFIQLLYRIVFFQVETKDCVRFLAHPKQSSEKENFRCRDLDACESSQRLRHLKFEHLHPLGLEEESFNEIQGALISIVASEYKDQIIVELTTARLRSFFIQLELYFA